MDENVLNDSISNAVHNNSIAILPTGNGLFWGLVIATLLLVLIFIYKYWERIQQFIFTQMVTLIIKAGKLEWILPTPEELDRLNPDDLVELYEKKLVVIDRKLKKTDPQREKVGRYKHEVKMKIRYNRLFALLGDMAKYIEKRDAVNSSKTKNEFEELLDNYDGDRKNSLMSKYDELCKSLKALELENKCNAIRALLSEEKLAEAVRNFEELKATYSPKETSEINEHLLSCINDKIRTAVNTQDLETLSNILVVLLDSSAFKASEFLQTAIQEAERIIKEKINFELNEFNFEKAEHLYDSFCNKVWCVSKLRVLLQNNIKEVKNSKKARIHSLLEEFEQALHNENISIAEEKLLKAEKLNDGNPLNEERAKLENVKADIKKKEDKQLLERTISDIKNAIAIYDITSAQELLNICKENPEKDDSTITELEQLLHSAQIALEEEKKYHKHQPIVQIREFNVPKKEDFGEDADPYVYVDSEISWGVISVFDGMGGAGARKYIHEETQEEHTSAYWASRFVHKSIKELIDERNEHHKGENPIEYIESHLHEQIKKKLDEEIVHFPSASSTMSKMIRKLPTTMAMCVYEIKDDTIYVNTYWAGDSRIYLFDTETMAFLTIDDADAPDNDPFSPANMDLAMSNAISQERPFKINKYEIEIPLNKEKPFVLMACSDGCFGYFRNPIKFERMVRSTLGDALNWNDWSDKMKDAIIKNGQSDDLSMVAVAIGVEEDEFEGFKQNMQQRLCNVLFDEYMQWEKDDLASIDSANLEINNLTEELQKRTDQLTSLRGKAQEYNKEKDAIEDFLKNHGVKKNLASVIEEIKDKYIDLDDIDTLEHQVEIIRNNLVQKKALLDELQLKMQDENNKWYEKYKSTIICDVESLTTI